MKILVIAPHPDDEVLGCGGTIAKLVGGKVYNGITVSSGDVIMISELSILDVVISNKHQYRDRMQSNPEKPCYLYRGGQYFAVKLRENITDSTYKPYDKFIAEMKKEEKKEINKMVVEQEKQFNDGVPAPTVSSTTPTPTPGIVTRSVPKIISASRARFQYSTEVTNAVSDSKKVAYERIIKQLLQDKLTQSGCENAKNKVEDAQKNGRAPLVSSMKFTIFKSEDSAIVQKILDLEMQIKTSRCCSLSCSVWCWQL